MTYGWLILSMLLLFVRAAQADSIPTVSLFFTPEQTRQAELLAEKAAPTGQADIRLGAVMYYGEGDWTLWLQGERWTPETSRDDLRVLDVTPQQVRLSWRGDDGQPPRDITLMPNQTYQIATGKITGGE